MKTKLLIIALFLSAVLLNSCKKDHTESAVQTDQLNTKEFSYNTATGLISPDEEINAELSSTAGIKLIYCYLVRGNVTDSLIFTGNPAAENKNNYKFKIPTVNFSSAKLAQVSGIRVMVKHLDNSSYEGMIKLTSFTPTLPKLENVPLKLLPDESGKITITGKASSENGLKLIEIYDDYQGTMVLADKISLTNNEKTYELKYLYTYRKNASNLKVVITDNFGLKAEALITIPLKAYNLYKDVSMMANGTAAAPSPSSFFIGETGMLLGSCSISGQESKLDFVTYCSSTFVFTIYSPSNTTTISKNFKCATQSWEPNAADLKATKFRTLIPGTAAADRIYAAYTANTITALDDQFFDGIAEPGSSTVKFDPLTANQAANTFNLTSAYLVWVKVPKADGTFTNQLLRAKEVVIGATAAVSTIKFDILVSK